MLLLHPLKTILLLQLLLSVSFFVTHISAQTSNADFLLKPHVLPSAERAYHAVYHELDSRVSAGNRNDALYGQLYVALIEDQFTFGGDMDEWDSSLFHNGSKGCKPFMGANVHHLCNDQFFLVHQDMIKLKKTVFQKGSKGEDPDFKTVCLENKNSGFKDTDDKDFLVYRYSHRILMTFKRETSDDKCFGTYDTRTDTFTCMRRVGTKLVPFEKQNFLWNETTGHFALGAGNAEVFCKELHYIN